MKKLLILVTLLVTLLASSQVKMSDMPTTTDTKNAYITVIQGGVNRKLPSDSLASMKDLRDSILHSVAVFTAKQLGVISDGVTDQTSRLNSLYSNPSIYKIIFSSGAVKISGKVDAQGKILVFENGAKLIGAKGDTDTLTNAFIECSYRLQVFDTSLNVVNLDNDIISVMWFGAVPDFKMDAAYSQTKTNNLKAFKKALACFKNKSTHSTARTASKLYIPHTLDVDHAYYLSNTWVIDRGVEIFGDLMDISQLVFPHGVNGIKFQTIN